MPGLPVAREAVAAIGAPAAPIGANQAARLPATGGVGIAGGVGDIESFNALNPPPFLPGKLKNAVDADPGNAGFPLGQPALLGGDETPELSPFAEIDGVIPLVAVFAGGPGFGLGKGVGLVDAAVKGLAPVFGQGFQDGSRAILVGKGLPVGTFPGDGPALRRGCPSPPIAVIKRNRARAATMLRRDMAISSRMGLGAWIADQYKPGWGLGQGICGAIFRRNFARETPASIKAKGPGMVSRPSPALLCPCQYALAKPDFLLGPGPGPPAERCSEAARLRFVGQGVDPGGHLPAAVRIKLLAGNGRDLQPRRPGGRLPVIALRQYGLGGRRGGGFGPDGRRHPVGLGLGRKAVVSAANGQQGQGQHRHNHGRGRPDRPPGLAAQESVIVSRFHHHAPRIELLKGIIAGKCGGISPARSFPPSAPSILQRVQDERKRIWIFRPPSVLQPVQDERKRIGTCRARPGRFRRQAAGGRGRR